MLTIGVVLATGAVWRIQRLTVTESAIAAPSVQSDPSSTVMLSGGADEEARRIVTFKKVFRPRRADPKKHRKSPIWVDKSGE